MYEPFIARLAERLAMPRVIKPQTQRQLERHCSEASDEIEALLRRATEWLEEEELDLVFAAQFTPNREDQVAVSDLLYHWRPTPDQIDRMTPDVCQRQPQAIIVLPGDVKAPLPLHEVMAERFIRLLGLQRTAEPCVSAALREILPGNMWPTATALLRQRGFTPRRQHWFVSFVAHMSRQHPISESLLATAAEFVAETPRLEIDAMVRNAGELVKAAHGLVSHARGGRAYWSADVAQHHHYRGQGEIDENLVQNRQDEEELLRQIEADLQTFDPDTDA